jgi:hypothetical protein
MKVGNRNAGHHRTEKYLKPESSNSGNSATDSS